jgi:hypothetical protein
MKTVICDICRKREAERCFKVKYKVMFWHRIDICKTCYEAFIDLRKGANK